MVSSSYREDGVAAGVLVGDIIGNVVYIIGNTVE